MGAAKRAASDRAKASTSSHSVKSQSREVSVGSPLLRLIRLSTHRTSQEYLVYATPPVKDRVIAGRQPDSSSRPLMYAPAWVGLLPDDPHTEMNAHARRLRRAALRRTKVRMYR